MIAERVKNFDDISASDAEAIDVTWMHCNDVIEGNFDVDLGRGRQLRRGGYWGRRRLVPSLDQLCQLANMAHAALEADEHNSSLHGSLNSMESLRDSACIFGASQPTPCEPSVDTPPALCPIPQHHEPGMGYAGWKKFGGRSRAPSPWPAKCQGDQPAKPRRSVRRFLREAKDSYKAPKVGRAIPRFGWAAKEARRSISAKVRAA